MHTTLRYQRLS